MSYRKIHLSTLKYLLIFTLIGMFASCKSREKLVYFQNFSQSDSLSIPYQFIFKPGDIVLIHVSNSDMESVSPFNPDFGTKTAAEGYTTGNAAREGYLVDSKGEISFPVLGKIKLGGLKREDAENLLAGLLKEYVSAPIINMRVMNFKVTVLGSVNQPGTFTVPNERITVFEAIGLAGDLKITGERKSVKVIRDMDGKKTEFKLDLTKAEVFGSPAYFLQQNDIVYIEPNNSERFSSSFLKSSGTLVFTAISIILTSIALIIR